MTPYIQNTFRVLILSLVVSLISFSSVGSQSQPHDYIKYLPLNSPRIIGQTDASRDLGLYGDPQNDINPVDGIDDDSYSRLLYLVQKFSPILIKNTNSAPMKIDSVKGTDKIIIDRWDITVSPPKKIGNAEYLSQSDKDYDFRINKLIENNLSQVKNSSIHPALDSLSVLFFDLPYDDVESWKRYWESFQFQPFIYAHPFIHSVSKDRFDFVIQYWFFYPFNDGGNNHEGDWEHINVVITLQGKADTSLTDREIWAILQTKNHYISNEQLVIKRVEYYFHHNVMVLNYVSPNVYQDSTKWESEVQNLISAQPNKEWIWRRIWERAHSIKNGFNTHPIGYIGGDDKSMVILLNLLNRSFNRNSHGTYPFSGFYKNIGPIDATERIQKNLPKAAQSDIVEFAEGQIQILPDWERIFDKIRVNAELRKKWSWFLLPVRWGQPASESPGAGLIEHADTGNLAPFGPAYNSGWNRVGPCRGYELYDAKQYSSRYLLGVKDYLSNKNTGWFGLSNIAKPIFVLPPMDLIFRNIPCFIKKFDPMFFPAEKGPSKRFTVTVLPQYGDDVTYRPALSEDQREHILQFIEDKKLIPLIDLYFFGGTPPFGLSEDLFKTKTVGLEVSHDLDKYWSTRHQFTYYLPRALIFGEPNLDPGKALTGDFLRSIIAESEFTSWQYIGWVRFNFVGERFHRGVTPYIQIGWGYTLSRLKTIKVRGTPLRQSSTEWFFTRPSLWPPWRIANTKAVGLGAHFVISRWLNLRVDLSYLSHRSVKESGSSVDMSGFYGTLGYTFLYF